MVSNSNKDDLLKTLLESEEHTQCISRDAWDSYEHIVSLIEDDGYVQISMTKDMCWISLTHVGREFIENGGYSSEKGRKIIRQWRKWIWELLLVLFGVIIGYWLSKA